MALEMYHGSLSLKCFAMDLLEECDRLPRSLLYCLRSRISSDVAYAGARPQYKLQIN